jgi:hypothetical protein
MRSKEFINEAVMSVGIQAKHPVSAGARSLMASRWRYDQAVRKNVDDSVHNAVDQLEHNLKYIPSVDEDGITSMVHHVCETFRLEPKQLHDAFSKKFNCSPALYAVNYKKSREGQPVKI